MALKLLDVEQFLKNETASRVSNPVIFGQNFEPGKNGLQDPSIFGVSKNDKFNLWGYINLEDVIMHPLVYDNLNIIDPIFKRVRDKKINAVVVDGMIKESKDGGGTGLTWLISKWDKINLDKYKTEKNKLWIDYLNNVKKNLIFIKKIPIIPIAYREAKMSGYKPTIDTTDEFYRSIMGMSKSGRSEFTSEYMQAFKDKNSKEMIQDKVNELYSYFVDRLEGKKGFMRGNLLAKRLDNVSRMVANARPDIPVNSAAIPWHILINLFDVFVVAYLQQEENAEVVRELGLSTDKGFDEYGQLFDYIYRNVDTYDKHYPKHRKIWIQILTDIFNANPMMRVLLKRDPGWNADSIWCFQPIIISENSYQIWVPSWVYSPLGGDSFNTNFYIQERDTDVIYEDDQYLIRGSQDTTFAVKNLDNVWKQANRERN